MLPELTRTFRATTSTDYCTPFSSALAIGIYTFCNVTSDILVMAIPLVILHYITKLPRERYAIFFLLFLGLGTIATTATCCALHITYRKQLMVYYSYVQLAELLACIELSVALMAVSLPSLKGVLYRRSERRQSKMSSSTGTTQTTQTTGKESKRSGSEMRGEVAEEEEAWEEDDERRLVIMRRVSYEVQSMELSELGRPGM